MAFAFGLLMGGHHLPECPRLQENTFIEGGLRLEQLLG
jgi:hypothetical protein